MSAEQVFLGRNAIGVDRSYVQEVIKEEITPERILEVLKPLSEAFAPSGTVAITTGPIIGEVFDLPSYTTREGNIGVNAGDAKRQLWTAHGDKISYYVDKDTFEGTDVIPLCAHRAQPGSEYPAKALRFVQAGKEEMMEIVTDGMLITKDNGQPYFSPSAGSPGVQIADRVALAIPFSLKQNGNVQGLVDNSDGMTAAGLAMQTLGRICRENGTALAGSGLGLLFSDGEEGNPYSNLGFAQGARKHLANYPKPDLFIDVDGHDVVEKDFGHGALYAGIVSGGKGPVVRPQIYIPFSAFMKNLESEWGIRSEKTERRGTVSRSDTVAAMEHTDVLAVGYGTESPHCNEGLPTVDPRDLVELARALVWTGLDFKPNL